MSVDTNIYIGPNVNIKKLPKENIKTEIKCCLNDECQEYKKPKNYNFCNVCGGPISSYTLEEEIDIDIDELLSNNKEIDLSEIFYSINNENYDEILLPNRKGMISGEYLDTDDEIFHSMNDINIKEEIENFKSDMFVQKLIELLEKNDIKYSIDYSLIHYYS